MIYPVLITSITSSFQEFIDCWSEQYYYPKNENYYNNNITKKILCRNDIMELYIWKNGMNLSAKKLEILEKKILLKLDIINDLKSQYLPILDSFLEEFQEVSFVWKIFLLHIINPNTYPIYDQHIHRAFNYLQSENNYNQHVTQNEFYFNHYLPFIRLKKIDNLKKLDEAFFAFGQFINTKKYNSLLKNRLPFS